MVVLGDVAAMTAFLRRTRRFRSRAVIRVPEMRGTKRPLRPFGTLGAWGGASRIVTRTALSRTDHERPNLGYPATCSRGESTRIGRLDNLLLGGSMTTTLADVAVDWVKPAVTAPEGSLRALPIEYSAPSATGLLRRCLQQIERDVPLE